jgi:hypothetical protein
LFFENLPPAQQGESGVRAEMAADKLLPGLVSQLKRLGFERAPNRDGEVHREHDDSHPFKNMLS